MKKWHKIYYTAAEGEDAIIILEDIANEFTIGDIEITLLNA